MQNIEKRIAKLKADSKKYAEKIKEYNQKISENNKKVEELENARIVLAFRSTGYSLDDVIVRLSSMTSEKSDKDDDFEKEFAAFEAQEKESKNNEA